MYKENGREKPADNKENADLKYTALVCTMCGNKAVYKVVFGEHAQCRKCGADMNPSVLDANKLQNNN